MIRRPPRSTRVRSSAASDVYKRQVAMLEVGILRFLFLQAINRRTPCSPWIPVSPKLSGRPCKATYHHGPPDMHPLGCHRLPIPDRDCFQGILVRLVTGCSWDLAARLCKASETTLRGRRTE